MPSITRHPRASGPLVHVNYAIRRRGLPASTSFRRWVAQALAGAGARADGELSVRLVDAEEGRALNQRYRGKDYATNVLSFPVELPPGVDVPLLGDLVICAPVVAREAAAQHKPIRHHYAHLTVHGTLHLLGFDHMKAAEAEAMEALERRILAALDVPDPYAMEARS